MGQSMVAITEPDCTGCDLCISHCPFEALLPLASNPESRQHKKRPIVVVASQCVGCLSCIGSCPTGALHEVQSPLDASQSTLLLMPSAPETEPVNRWKKGGIRWA